MDDIRIPMTTPEPDTNLQGFQTKDSGKREQFSSGMQRDTQEGKVRVDLAFDGPLSGYDLLRDLTPEENLADRRLIRNFEVWDKYGGCVNAIAVLQEIAKREGGAFKFFKRIAELMTRGAIKYTARNWMQANGVPEFERFHESARRHFLQYMAGERDEDHGAAVWFNLNGAEYVAKCLETPF